ncbi:endolytic transglycosylase MltG [Bacilliculturomica massiliensis]|uniref:endolytic transglycosylase MltG n=1 Tax=Bacilliculturomica massiliensis TaxID=1917867 RepID=UPI001030CDAF|nr:endolytic transglycosylase MltG [Bacilliculturomica massiliensis]
MGRRHRKKKKILPIIVGIAAVFVIAFAGFTVWMNSAAKPVDEGNTEQVSVTIPSGTGTGGIAQILEEKGLISSAAVFKFQSRSKGYDGKYKAGEYSLTASMSMTEIMDALVSGNVNTMRFTIPEGYTVKQTRDKLAAEGLVNGDLFDQEVASGQFDYRFLDGAPSGENRLEGYLYPETYDVFTTANEHDIINRMLAQFDKIFTDEFYSRARERNLSVNEVLTIASMIERETRVDSERAKVASVIYNRLEQGRKLQIDATVQYALGEQKERLLYKDLEIDSPYNTYKIEGLPPGPICSPGVASIKAALYPEDTDYLFYVLKPELNGEHNFAETEKQFQNYKNQYINAIK